MSDELFHKYSGYAKRVASCWIYNNHMQSLKEDCMQAAMLGFLLACRRNDTEELSNKYIAHVTVFAIQDYLRDQDICSRRHRKDIKQGKAKQPEVCGVEFIYDAEDHKPVDFLGNSLLKKSIASLPFREREVLYSIYFNDEKSVDVAKRLGVSSGMVTQLHNKAIAKLKGELHEHF